jgi:hypothetical protein
MTFTAFYVFRDEDRTRIDVDGDVLGWGVEFPSGWCVVDWNRDAFPEDDRLDHSHLSQYGSIRDVEQGTGGKVSIAEVIDPVPDERWRDDVDETIHGTFTLLVVDDDGELTPVIPE